MGFLRYEDAQKLGFKSLGKNVLISDKASIYGAEFISIGDYSRIDDFCLLSASTEGGIEIGRYVHISAYSSLVGRAQITMKDFSGLSSRVAIYSSSDDYSGEHLTNPTVPDEYKKIDSRPVTLEKHVIVGSGSVILPGVTLKQGSAVGALSLLHRDIENYTIVTGVPARKIANRKTDLIEIEKLLDESIKK
jgi:acetyltransferase-like isoleucine patch superfamily enzyme